MRCELLVDSCTQVPLGKEIAHDPPFTPPPSTTYRPEPLPFFLQSGVKTETQSGGRRKGERRRGGGDTKATRRICSVMRLHPSKPGTGEKGPNADGPLANTEAEEEKKLFTDLYMDGSVGVAASHSPFFWCGTTKICNLFLGSGPQGRSNISLSLPPPDSGREREESCGQREGSKRTLLYPSHPGR